MGKHSIEKKKINFGKTFLVIIVLALVIAGIIGVIYVIKNNRNTQTEFLNQEEAINNAFSALKTSNIDEVEKYLNYTELISGLDESILQEEITGVESNLFNTMEWSIENIKEDDDGSIVAIIDVKNKNYKNIITEWLKQIVDLKSNSDQISNVESLQILENILKENNCGTQSVIKKIQLIEESGNWKIVVNDNLINLLYPGIETINNVI